MGFKENYAVNDVESGSPPRGYTEDKHGVLVDETGAVRSEMFTYGDSTYAKIQRFAGRFNIEQRGIERVPEDERTDTTMSKVGTLWLSANMVVSSFAIGVLAVPIFDLGFVDALLTIFFINILGIFPVCFFSTFGPIFGLRQMVLSRFYFGYYAVKLVAFFNVLACLGWSAVNVIVGAQLLNAVNGNVPGWAGIIVIAAATFLITLFGYKVVHHYEYWSWIPSFIIFLIVLGEFAHSGSFDNIPRGYGSSEAGAVLSFAASVFGFATGWTSYAADYTVYQPANSSRMKIFLWTFGGLFFPLAFTEMLGLAIVTGTVNNPNLYAGYTNDSVGGLLAAVLSPLGGFGKFCLVILALSIIANNCPNIYSVTFSLQVMARWTAAVPRFIWTFVGTLIYVAVAIPGYSHFSSALEDFLLLIGYWLAIYEGIAVTEHVVFKRSRHAYHLPDYRNASALPPGIAAIAAFCFGIMGAVLGMAQPWFTGPIGKLIGNPQYGGDVGFELAFAFTATSYVILRTLEKKYFKR